MRPDFDEMRTLTKRFVLVPQKMAKFVFGVFRYAGLSVLGDYKLRKAINSFVRSCDQFQMSKMHLQLELLIGKNKTNACFLAMTAHGISWHPDGAE